MYGLTALAQQPQQAVMAALDLSAKEEPLAFRLVSSPTTLHCVGASGAYIGFLSPFHLWKLPCWGTFVFCKPWHVGRLRKVETGAFPLFFF